MGTDTTSVSRHYPGYDMQFRMPNKILSYHKSNNNHYNPLNKACCVLVHISQSTWDVDELAEIVIMIMACQLGDNICDTPGEERLFAASLDVQIEGIQGQLDTICQEVEILVQIEQSKQIILYCNFHDSTSL